MDLKKMGLDIQEKGAECIWNYVSFSQGVKKWPKCVYVNIEFPLSGLKWEFMMSWNGYHKRIHMNQLKKPQDPSNYSFC